MTLINNKYKIIKQLGEGCYGKVFMGENIRTKELVAIKIEPNNTDGALLLRNETIYYEYLKGPCFIPKLKWFGKDSTNYYLVIEYLLKPLPVMINNSKFDLFIDICSKILLIIEHVHYKGLIHRDIKPDNFLINNKNIINIIDFGFCKSYINNNQHIEFSSNNDFIGSMNYASINVHKGYTYSRRDDLESICYLFYYLLHGRLPWSDKYCDDILEMKEKFNEISDDIKLTTLWNKIRSIKFDETPNYQLLINIIK